MHIGFCMKLVELYTKPGDVILDPMAGSGTTMVAALLGRAVVLVELEEHFIVPMQASREKIQRVGPMQGHQLGAVSIIHGDARVLEFTGPDSATTILTSPPYEQHHQGGDDSQPGQQQGGLAGRVQARYGLGENIGNLSGAAYMAAMEQFYRECHRVLKPGGTCIVVMKDIVRDKKVVPLVEQTRELLEAVGFAYQERLVRTLSQLSFWRILQTTVKRVVTHGQQSTLFDGVQEVQTVKRIANGAPVIDTETALVVRKP